MNAGKPDGRRFSWWKASPKHVSLLIVVIAFLTTLGIRHLGLLQFLEFYAYDFFIRHQQRTTTSGPIVLVEMTEADIHSPSLDYPIYDEKLAELLRVLLKQEPVVIGLDI